jgi:hypothetical protein
MAKRFGDLNGLFSYKKKRKNDEYIIQKAAVKWFRKSYPQYAMCLQASLNGIFLGQNEKIRYMQISKAKATGMVVGQSDLFLALPRGGFCGKYIEVKSESGIESSDQAKFGNEMIQNGYDYSITHGLDSLVTCIYEYMCNPPTYIAIPDKD